MKVKPNTMIEIRVDQNGVIRTGFGNEKGGVYVEIDTIPEMMFERAIEYCRFIYEQPNTYREFCEYHGLNPDDVDTNADFFVQKKAVKDMIEKMGLFEDEKQQKLKPIK